MALAQTSYYWPTPPFQQQHWINGTFCENRPNSSGTILRDHFHNGIDIHLPEGGPVYSVIDGVVTSVYPSGGNSYIRIGKFAYVHVTPNPTLAVGDSVKAYRTIIGATNYRNHIHFIEGYYNEEVNPLLEGHLTPFEDPYQPTIAYIRFHPNGSDDPFPGNWVSGLVDIVARAYDRTDLGPISGNNGIYRMGYQIFAADGKTPLTEPIVHFQFHRKPGNQFIKNVYARGSDVSTYIYIPSNFIQWDGAWDTRSLTPGPYVVAVFVADTRGNTDTLKVSVEVRPVDTIPPSPPTLQSIWVDETQNLRIRWTPPTDADLRGFRFFFSYDGQHWTQRLSESTLTGHTTEAVFPNFTVPRPIFFKLTAVDSAAPPNESLPSDVYGLRFLRGRPKVLIVDGFDRTTGGWNQPFHHFVQIIGEAIASSGDVAFESCANEAVASAEVSLQDYDAVVYLLGDEGLAQESFDRIEQEWVAQYLQAGGNLLVTGAEVAYDLGGDSASVEDQNFLRDYLRASFKGTLPGQSVLKGLPGTLFDGLSITLGQYYQPAHIDRILPLGGAVATFAVEDTNAVGLQYEGSFGTSGNRARLIYLAFPLETVATAELRAEIMRRVLTFFGLVTPSRASGYSPASPRDFLFQAYPNPARLGGRSSTAITFRFRLPHRDWTRVEIVNVLGQVVRAWPRTLSEAGEHSILWDGRNEKGQRLSPGVYLCRLHTSWGTQSIKLTLVR